MDVLSLAKWLYAARGLRPGSQIEGLYSDPAWDILLDLYIRERSGIRTSITAACIAARAPPTTALRHIAILRDRKMIERRPDALDRRRHWLVLTPATVAALDDYLADILATLNQRRDQSASRTPSYAQISETLSDAVDLIEAADQAALRAGQVNQAGQSNAIGKQ